MNKFAFLNVFNSPFKPPKIQWYFGKIEVGTPYFLPRKWVNNPNKPGYMMAVPKKVGFDFVGLGYKTKWNSTDYRFEWAPVWSFVFFKWQIAITFNAPHPYHYWVCWLTYFKNTDRNLSIKKRIEMAKEINPEIWTSYIGEKDETTCYWDKIIKEKYL